MSYVDKVLQPGETVLARGELHWIIYVRGVLCLLAAAILFFIHPSNDAIAKLLLVLVGLFALLGLYLLIVAWFHSYITEIAVTNRRIIFKRGLLQRETEEMNVDKVETVMVRQSVLGRILGYGTIDIRGTGEGMEDLRTLADPLQFRSAITTHAAPR